HPHCFYPSLSDPLDSFPSLADLIPTHSEKTVHIWNAKSGITRYTYHGHTLGISTVAWSPDGQHIASGSLDGTVRVWQA
ncbi:MAG TPA: hypothetical protein VGL94_15125, partial [Ktedonobacteraceae bacterium]